MKWLIDVLLKKLLDALPVEGLRGILALLLVGGALLLVGPEAVSKLSAWLSSNGLLETQLPQ